MRHRPPPARRPRHAHPCVFRLVPHLPQFQKAVQELVESFPAGQCSRITVDLLASCIIFGKACFTFNFIKGREQEERSIENTKYGTTLSRRWARRVQARVQARSPVCAWARERTVGRT